MKHIASPIQILLDQLRLNDFQNADTEGRKPFSHIETVVGNLQLGRVHEWFGVEHGSEGGWYPPLTLFCGIADQLQAQSSDDPVLWVGRRVWPYPAVLGPQLCKRSIFIDPGDVHQRLWAMDTVLRSDAIVAVMGDGTGLNMQATRRLQLAAEAGGGLALLARPAHEIAHRSAATYRWRVEVRHGHERPCWSVELIRNKSGGMRYGLERQGCTVEWRHGQGLIAVPAVVADRTVETARSIA